MRFIFWVQMASMLVLEALHDAIKNPESKAKYRADMVKVHQILKTSDQAICANWPNDPEFL